MSYNVNILGHCKILDDNNNVILDQKNDIHPANMARIISRGLAGEQNHWISSLKLGDMGSYPTNDGIIHRSANDGLEPDYNGWRSSLYNQTYTKYIDNTNLTIRSIESANSNFGLPLTDPLFNAGSINANNSSLEINLLLDSDEPFHQQDGGVYVFDELALYSGLSNYKNSSSHVILLNLTEDSEHPNLINNHDYKLDIKINDVIRQYTITTLKYGTGINYRCTYLDLIEALTNAVYDPTFLIQVSFNKLAGSITFYSPNSVIEIVQSNDKNWLFNIPSFNGFGLKSVTNNNIAELELEQTDKNNINNPLKEAPRLLTHMTFNPVRKPALSNYYLTYCIDILVDRTDPVSDDYTIPDDYRVTSPFIFHAVTSSNRWTINHNLGYYPKINVFINDILYTTYQTSYPSVDSIVLIFATPQIGVAKLV